MKDVENRSWVPKLAPGDRFAIHAGLVSESIARPGMLPSMVEGSAEEIGMLSNLIDRRGPAARTCALHGVVLATVELVEVIRNSTSPWAEDDQYHWVLGSPKLLDPPRPARGQFGLWIINEWRKERMMATRYFTRYIDGELWMLARLTDNYHTSRVVRNEPIWVGVNLVMQLAGEDNLHYDEITRDEALGVAKELGVDLDGRVEYYLRPA